MKVYLITRGEYSDYYVVAVKLDREEAEKVCAVKNAKLLGDICMIEEYDTDDEKVDLGIEVKKVYTFNDYYNELHISEPIYTISDMNKLECHSGYGKKWISGTATFQKSVTDEKAHKIIQDRVAKFKAEKEGIC